MIKFMKILVDIVKYLCVVRILVIQISWMKLKFVD